MSTQEPAPGNRSEDELRPAVNPSELKVKTIELPPTVEAIKRYFLDKEKVARLNLSALPGSFITQGPGRVAKGAYEGDEPSLGYTGKETNALPTTEFDEIVTKYFDAKTSAAHEISRENDGLDDVYEKIEAFETALTTLVASYDLANNNVPPSYYEQMDYIYSWRKPWSTTQDKSYFDKLKP